MESPSAGFDKVATEGITEAHSRLLLETLVASTPVGLAVVDLEERFIQVNEALAELNGIPRAAHLGRMRELTELRRGGDLVDTMLADHGLFHLEADLRWIELTSARLTALAEQVRP